MCPCNLVTWLWIFICFINLLLRHLNGLMLIVKQYI
jgi:hypothetical protein